jgi:hypothetical protein
MSDLGPFSPGALFLTATDTLVQVVAVRGEEYDVRIRWPGAGAWWPLSGRPYSHTDLTELERLA